MCQADGKRWIDYWRLESTQDYLAVVSSDVGIPTSTLVRSTRGGRTDEQGTHIHRRVAYDLAACFTFHHSTVARLKCLKGLKWIPP